jgi:hypothetical protein
MCGIVVGQGHSVKGNNFEWLFPDLHIQVAVGRRIYDAPKLALTRSEGDARAELTVHSENFGRMSIRCRKARRLAPAAIPPKLGDHRK